MSDNNNDSSGHDASEVPLRWVRYDGIYYVALLVPAEEASFATVPPGHSFVFFLDGESGAVVPDDDVLPYDANDVAKASHPAAAAGVALAQQILQGSGSGSGNNNAAESTDAADGVAAAAAAAHAATSGELPLLSDDDDDDDADEDVLTMLTSNTAAAARRQRRGQDAADDSAPAVAATTTTTTHRDDARDDARRTTKRRHHHDNDNDDDHDNNNDDNDDDNDNEADRFAQPLDWNTLEDEFATSAQPHGARRGKHATRRRRHTADGDSDEDEDAIAARRGGGGDDDDGGVFGHAARALSSATRTRAPHAGAGGNTAAAMLLPHLSKIRYYYRRLQDEAAVQNKLLSRSEADVVRAVEQALVQARVKATSLAQAVRAQLAAQAATRSRAADEHQQQQQQQHAAMTTALHRTLRRLEREGSDVRRLVRRLVHMRPAPPSHDEDTTRLLPPHARARVRRDEPISSFADATTAFVLERAARSTAPRELTVELANKYREQRAQRERVLAFSQGLGKTGLCSATPRLLERWTRARELMVLAPAHENQPVKPVGYVARRFAESLQKVERYALRRLSQGTVGDGGVGGATTTTTRLRSFLAPSTSDLLSTYQSQTRQRQQQAYPAYYSFHDLRPTAAAASAGDAMTTTTTTTTAAAAGGDVMSVAAAMANADAYRAEPSLLMALTASAADDGDGHTATTTTASGETHDTAPLITPLHLVLDADGTATTTTTTTTATTTARSSDMHAIFAIDATEAAAAAEAVHNVTGSTAYNSLRHHHYSRTRSASGAYDSHRHTTDDSAAYDNDNDGGHGHHQHHSVLLPSASIRMPSQESQFYSALTHASEQTATSMSELPYDDDDDDDTGGATARRRRGGAAVMSAASSRATSLASSVMPSESMGGRYNDDDNDDKSTTAAGVRDRYAHGARTRRHGSTHALRRHGGGTTSSSAAAMQAPPSLPAPAAAATAAAGSGNWRESAKRALLEQLTLYLRGLHGKPAVLSRDEFATVARRLLERAVRRESERTGVSLALQANNATLPFTKSTAASLKRSVDTYVFRHYIASHRSALGASDKGVDGGGGGGGAETSAPYARRPGTVPLMQPPLPHEDGRVNVRVYARDNDDDDDDERAQQPSQTLPSRSVGDSPVYDI